MLAARRARPWHGLLARQTLQKIEHLGKVDAVICPSIRARALRAALAAIAVLAVLALAAGCGARRARVAASGPAPVTPDTATGFAGAELPGSKRAPGFTLRDQAGRQASLSDYRGRVTLLAFVDSRCGPACILMAQQIRGALDELPPSVAALFVSADPAADTPPSVRRFLARVSLSGRARYLTGPRSRLAPVWRAYGVLPASSGRAAFARALSVRLVDRSGRQRVIFGLEQLTPEALAHDIRKLS